MSATPKEKLNAMNARFMALGKAIPGSMGAFQKLMGEASKDGVLSGKFKAIICFISCKVSVLLIVFSLFILNA